MANKTKDIDPKDEVAADAVADQPEKKENKKEEKEMTLEEKKALANKEAQEELEKKENEQAEIRKNEAERLNRERLERDIQLSKEEKAKIQAKFKGINARDMETPDLESYVASFVGSKLDEKTRKRRDDVARELAFRNRTKRDIFALKPSQLTRSEMMKRMDVLGVKYDKEDPNMILRRNIREHMDNGRKIGPALDEKRQPQNN